MDNMVKQLKPLRTEHQPVVIGTGLVALDVIIPCDLNTDPYLCVGGTCGNVLTALAFLGWKSYPLARLSTNAASKRVADDLRHWGVKTDFVTFDDDGSTPVVVQHIHNSKSGEPRHSFSRKCPKCGAFLPWYKAVRVADISNLVPQLPRPNVFFFDRTSRGALSLARESREQGAVVYFEPSASSDPNHLREAIELSHIIKVSADRIAGNEAALSSNDPKIVIETLGNAGLRFRFNGARSKRSREKWHEMPPIPAITLRDTAGAGDWCTAGIVYMLCGNGASGLVDLTLDEVLKAIRVGQAMASWTCGFDGPRGGMYSLEKPEFAKKIINLLNGRNRSRGEEEKLPTPTGVQFAFVCESCSHKSHDNGHQPQKAKSHEIRSTTRKESKFKRSAK